MPPEDGGSFDSRKSSCGADWSSGNPGDCRACLFRTGLTPDMLDALLWRDISQLL
jgi:hypothetical protein